MEHIFKEGQKGAPVFVLLHGTGGTENDLLPLAEVLNKDYSVLSVRGNVQENGMNRYFKRLGEGKYDLEDLEFRGQELLDFLKDAAKDYNFNVEDAIFVGFSNGSNIAINLLLREDADFKKAMLFAPLYPVDISDNDKDLSNLDVFLSLGKGDPIVSETASEDVIKLFEERNAGVHSTWVNGHNLTQDAAVEGREWLNK